MVGAVLSKGNPPLLYLKLHYIHKSVYCVRDRFNIPLTLPKNILLTFVLTNQTKQHNANN